MTLIQRLLFTAGWLLEWLREHLFAHPPSDVFYVSGRYLYDNGGGRVVLRGVNLPLLDGWSFPGADKVAEIEKTGANAVRIQWYMSYPDRPAYTLSDLDGTNVSGHPTSTDFQYQPLLVKLTQREIGWLAWAWTDDSCASRRITPDGSYTGAIDGSPTGLTPYGEDIVNNATYGIRMGYVATTRSPSLPGAPPPP